MKKEQDRAAQTNVVKTEAASNESMIAEDTPSKNGEAATTEPKAAVVIPFEKSSTRCLQQEETSANVSVDTVDWGLCLMPSGCNICLCAYSRFVVLVYFTREFFNAPMNP